MERSERETDTYRAGRMVLGSSTMSSHAREMTVSHRQKRWKRAMSKDGHMDAHIVERD